MTDRDVCYMLNRYNLDRLLNDGRCVFPHALKKLITVCRIVTQYEMLLPTRSRPISFLRALHRSWRSHAGATDLARAEEPLLGCLGEVVRHTWYFHNATDVYP